MAFSFKEVSIYQHFLFELVIKKESSSSSSTRSKWIEKPYRRPLKDHYQVVSRYIDTGQHPQNFRTDSLGCAIHETLLHKPHEDMQSRETSNPTSRVLWIHMNYKGMNKKKKHCLKPTMF